MEHSIYTVLSLGQAYYDDEAQMELLTAEGRELVARIRSAAMTDTAHRQVCAYLERHGASCGFASVSPHRLDFYHDCSQLTLSQAADRLEWIVDAAYTAFRCLPEFDRRRRVAVPSGV